MDIFISVLPIILTITIGYIIRIKKIFSEDFMENISSLVINLMLPMSLLLTFSTTSYSIKSLVAPALLAVSVLLMHFIAKRVMKLFKIKQKFFPATASLFEGGLIGYTLFPILFIGLPLSAIASIDFGQGMIAFSVVFVSLASAYEDNVIKKSLKEKLIDFIKSPIMFSILFGIFLSLIKFTSWNENLTAAYVSVTSFISAPCSVLILIKLGYQLSIDTQVVKTALKISLSKVLINIIGLTFMLTLYYLILGYDRTIFFIIIFLFTLPQSFLTTSFIKSEKEKLECSTATTINIIITLIFFIILKLIY